MLDYVYLAKCVDIPLRTDVNAVVNAKYYYYYYFYIYFTHIYSTSTTHNGGNDGDADDGGKIQHTRVSKHECDYYVRMNEHCELWYL